jgi:hypothetical protein
VFFLEIEQAICTQDKQQIVQKDIWPQGKGPMVGALLEWLTVCTRLGIDRMKSAG